MTKASDNAFPSLLITEGTEPSAPAAGKQRLYIDSTSHKLKRTDSSAVDVTIEAGVAAGTSFPGSPADGDLYFRTDLDLLCRYRSTGTRWVTTTQYVYPISATDALMPVSVTNNGGRAQMPLAGVSALWLENFQAAFYVVGGTALSGSHKWVVTLSNNPASATLATITIDSGAKDTWRDSGQISIAAVSATTEFGLQVGATKTGTPGNLYVLPTLSYRVIVT